MPYCSHTTAYAAGFDVDVNPSLPGSPDPAQPLSMCNYQQTAGGKRRKSRKKTKRKKKAGALATIVFATAAYCTLNAYRAASAFVLMYNTLKKPDPPLTVTQATLDYLKEQGRGLLSFTGLNPEEKMKLANGYDAYIKRYPDKISVEVRPEEKFGVDPDVEKLYEAARKTGRRASYKPKRGKKSRRKSRRKKRSQRGASLGPPTGQKPNKSLGLTPVGKGPTRKGQKPKKSLGLTPVRKGPRREGVPPEPHISEGVTPNIPRHDDPLRPEERWICNTNKKCVRAPKSSIGEKYYPTPNQCMKKTKCKDFEEYKR